jgi:ketosteroid isomerase-like protein
MPDPRRRPRRPPALSRLRSLPLDALLALLLTATLAACAGGGGKAAIEALVTKEVAAVNARNLAALSEIWSSDPEILLFDVPAPGRFQGWERIARVYKDFFDRCSELQVTVRNVRARAEGSLGYATYDWSMSGRMGDYTLRDHGQATAIYRREKNGWRLIHLHYSAAPPGQPEVTETAPEPVPGATPKAKGAPSPAASPAAGAAAGRSTPPPSPSPTLPAGHTPP